LLLSLVGLNVPLMSGPLSGRNATAASLKVIVRVPVAPPLPPTSEKTMKVAPVGLTSSISTSSGRALRWKLLSVSVTLVVELPMPETRMVLGYGVAAPESLNVIGPPTNVPGGMGVGVGVGTGVAVGLGVAVGVGVAVGTGVGEGVGVGVGTVAVIVRVQSVTDPVSPVPAPSSTMYRLQVPFGLVPLKRLAKVSGPAPTTAPPGLP